MSEPGRAAPAFPVRHGPALMFNNDFSFLILNKPHNREESIEES
jgi:hypothetical protein